MNRKKKRIILLTAGLIGILALTGCKENKKNPDSSKKPGELSEYADSAVLKINGLSIDYREAMLYLQASRQEYEATYGKDIWNYVLNADGATLGEEVKEKTLEQMIYQKIICAQGKRLGIELDSEEKKAVSDRTEKYMQKADYSTLAMYGIARKNVEQIFLDTAMTQKIYDSVTLNVDTDVSNEEAEQKHLQGLMLKLYHEDENGNREKLSVSELLRTLDRFDSLYTEAKETNDFYSLAFSNTDDKQYLDFWVGTGDLPEELSAAYELSAGETMQLKLTDQYYIFHCVTDFDEDAIIKKKEELIAARQESEFQKLYETWKAEAKIELSEDVWKSICEEMNED